VGLPSPLKQDNFGPLIVPKNPIIMKNDLHVHLRLSIFLLFMFSAILQSQGQIRYVKHDASGNADGGTWTNAGTDLQLAIDQAVSGDTLFVARGTYYPSFRHLGDSSRHSTFYINKSIVLFGGFSGVPGTEGGFSERDAALHPTILSGDIGVAGDLSDNAFHVLYLDHVSDSMRIDGFTITKGNGTGGAGLEPYGAGIYNDADGGVSNPTIANCIILDNLSSEAGAGMSDQAQNGGIASPTLINCTFTGNKSGGGGGINIYTDTDGQVSPLLIGCRFIGNSGPTAGGGAIQLIAHSSIAAPKFINCLFTGNHSPNSAPFSALVTGTAVANIEIINSTISGNSGSSMRLVDLGLQTSTVVIRNSILYGNGASQAPSVTGFSVDAAYSVIPFGFPGEGMVGLDPMFVDQPPVLDSAHVLGDVHLLVGSPAIDAGSNSAMPVGITTDADHLPRLVNAINGQPGTIDIGAFELQADITGLPDQLADDDWNIFPNPTSGQCILSLKGSGHQGTIRVTDLSGKGITTLLIDPGQMEYPIQLSGLPVGMYFVQLTLDREQGVRKIVLRQE
jgi:hypothetical protein